MADKNLSVVDAVHRELDQIAKRDPDLALSGYAATAIALARDLDDPSSSATSKSMCARSLSDALDRLRELAPAEEKEDELDKLRNSRAKRLTRGTKATNKQRS